MEQKGARVAPLPAPPEDRGESVRLSPRPRQRAPPRPPPPPPPPANRHPQAGAPPSRGRAASRPPRRHHPSPEVGAAEPGGAGGAGGAYLPWASRMAACDSAGTWPPPPSPGLETWRAGTKMAAPPNFHCYFGHSSSYFLGTQLPPCDGSGGDGTGTRLRHGGDRAEGERPSEGREGRVEGMGEEAKKRGGREGKEGKERGSCKGSGRAPPGSAHKGRS